MPLPHCGVDFGTSNSSVAWYHQGQATLLPLEEERTSLPSAIFFHADDDGISHGQAAINDYLEGYEGRLMRAMKSLLGSPLMEGQTEVQGRALPFRLLLKHFIQTLRTRASLAAGTPFQQAVFGRPVHFVDDDPRNDQLAQDTLADIAREVGFEHVEFQYEPLAAAFSYEQTLQGEQCVMVVDIGGGTSDFSIVRLGPERAARLDRQPDILATAGVHIGGTDFDKYLSLGSVMPELGLGSALKSGKDMPSTVYFQLASWHTINQVYSRKQSALLSTLQRESAAPALLKRLLHVVEQRSGHALAMEVERAKIKLTDHPQVQLNLGVAQAGLEHTVTQSDFNHYVGHLVERISQAVHDMLQQAQLPANGIDALYFTGGASAIPVLQTTLSRHFNTQRNIDGDRFGSICTGLAIDAHRRFGPSNP